MVVMWVQKMLKCVDKAVEQCCCDGAYVVWMEGAGSCTVLKDGACWCRLCMVVLDGAMWCRMVTWWCEMMHSSKQNGAQWCRMVHSGAGWCMVMQDSAGWCRMRHVVDKFKRVG